jgi:CubicO group peptidase (beta-lactamase class C family)
LETRLATTHLPALGAVVFTDDKTLALAVRGVRKAGSQIPATVNDRWHLGSNTKSMTASLAAILINEGKLRWTTTIGETLPDVRPDYASVTLQQLMEHRSGMSHDGRFWNEFTTKTGSPQQTRRWWVTENLKFPPQKTVGRYAYSNLGFATAGYLLESYAGHPWETLIQNRLWKPLGITTGGFGMPGTPGKVDQPWGHAAHGQPIPPGPEDDNPRGLGPAGTAHISLSDYVKYAQWHLTSGVSHPGLLPPEAFTHMHASHATTDKNEPAYEAGWLLAKRPWAGGVALTHAGTNTMNYIILWLAPEKHFGFAVVTNQGGDKASKALDELAGAIINEMN